MAHFTCVGATTAELREMLDTMRDAGIDNVLALRGDPPQGQTEWTATEGGLQYSRELIELIRDEYDFAIGAACFPEVHLHATDAESDLRYLQGEGRRGRALPHHAAVLRQRRTTTTSSPARATRASTCRSSPASADHQRRPDQEGHGDVRRPAAGRRGARVRAARRPARRGGGPRASPTRPSSAPTCWPTARRGSTSTRSTARTATRAILSALRLQAPWRNAVAA